MARLKLKHGSRIKPDTRKVTLNLRGRSKRDVGVFLPDKLKIVRLVAMKGASDEEIAKQFGVSKELFAKWRDAYPSFEKALDEGRLECDADVVVSLYQQTQGYHYTEETAAGKDGHIVEVKRYARPDTEAMKYWLKCRKPDAWSDRHVVSGGRGKDGSELPVGIKVETRNELIDSILSLIQPKPDPKPERPKADRNER